MNRLGAISFGWIPGSAWACRYLSQQRQGRPGPDGPAAHFIIGLPRWLSLRLLAALTNHVVQKVLIFYSIGAEVSFGRINRPARSNLTMDEPTDSNLRRVNHIP